MYQTHLKQIAIFFCLCLFSATDADACSFNNELDLIWPTDGQTDLALNTTPIFYASGYSLEESITVADTNHTPVSMNEADVGGDMRILAPNSSLTPYTSYSMTSSYSIETPLTFTTGDQIDQTAPSYDVARIRVDSTSHVAASDEESEGSCGGNDAYTLVTLTGLDSVEDNSGSPVIAHFYYGTSTTTVSFTQPFSSQLITDPTFKLYKADGNSYVVAIIFQDGAGNQTQPLYLSTIETTTDESDPPAQAAGGCSLTL